MCDTRLFTTECGDLYQRLHDVCGIYHEGRLSEVGQRVVHRRTPALKIDKQSETETVKATCEQISYDTTEYDGVL